MASQVILDPSISQLPLYIQNVLNYIAHNETLPDSSLIDSNSKLGLLYSGASYGKDECAKAILGLTQPTDKTEITRRFHCMKKAHKQIEKRENVDSSSLKNPYACLRSYVQATALPPLRWPAKFSNTPNPDVDEDCYLESPFGAVPDNVRRLGSIRKIEPDVFGTRVRSYTEKHIPNGLQRIPGPSAKGKDDKEPSFYDRDGRYPHCLDIPAPGFSINTSPELFWPADEYQRVFNQTASVYNAAARILKICNADAAYWKFGKNVLNWHKYVLRTELSYWQPPWFQDGPPSEGPILVIDLKMPWSLGVVDFMELVDVPKLRNLEDMRHPETIDGNQALARSFTKSERIWAQIYDSCVLQGTFFFVITTYDCWIFGVFSLDYSTADISPVMFYDSCKPTILECLLYWMQSAWAKPETYAVPPATGALPRDAVFTVEGAKELGYLRALERLTTFSNKLPKHSSPLIEGPEVSCRDDPMPGKRVKMLEDPPSLCSDDDEYYQLRFWKPVLRPRY